MRPYAKDLVLPDSSRRLRFASFLAFLFCARVGLALALFSCLIFFFSASVSFAGALMIGMVGIYQEGEIIFLREHHMSTLDTSSVKALVASLKGPYVPNDVQTESKTFAKGVLWKQRYGKWQITTSLVYHGAKPTALINTCQQMIQYACNTFLGKKILTYSTLKIRLYATHAKKHVCPGDLLSPISVNSGYSQPGLVVVFRREEMEKVLMHELIHVMVPHHTAHWFHPAITPLIPACEAGDARLYEAWVEFLAVHHYGVFSGYHIPTWNARVLSFTIHQIAQILHHVGYQSVGAAFRPGSRMLVCLSKDTHVFSYFLMKGALMHTLQHRMIDWSLDTPPERWMTWMLEGFHDLRFRRAIRDAIQMIRRDSGKHGFSLRFLPRNV